MGEALAHAYFLDQIIGRGHTRVSAVISTYGRSIGSCLLLGPNYSTNYYFDKNDRLVITCKHIGMKGLSIIRVVNDKDFQVIKANVSEIRFPFLCSYVPSLVRLSGFWKQDNSRIRWRKRRFS